MTLDKRLRLAQFRTRTIISRGLFLFNPVIEGQFNFVKILALYTVSVQERVIMKGAP